MKLLSEELKGKKKPLIIICAVAGLLLALMIIGTFLDYQIAHAVTAPYRGFLYYAFGMTFEFLGFLPAILVNVSLFAVLSVYSKKKCWKIAFHIFTAASLAGAVFCAVFWTLDNHGYGVSGVIAGPIVAVAGAALSFPVILFFKRFDEIKLKKLIYILAIAAVLGSLTNLVVGVMQVFWGRYRFYQVTQNGFPYGPWYRPIGRGGDAESRHGSNSFPSLHAASVCSTIALVLAAWVLKTKKSTFITFGVITGAMLILVPLSRMVLGWHYLTDVIFALIVGLIALVAAVIIIDKGFGKKFKRFLNGDDESNNYNNSDTSGQVSNKEDENQTEAAAI
ncbi:MAG: phosphatase PAP2 family protein [Firmicutes bacterium]|nr:phosphatase PAP2 family protein [Bacillota bacterium]